MKRIPVNALIALLLSGIFSATYGQKAPDQVGAIKNSGGISTADASAERDRIELEQQNFAFEKEIKRQKIADQERRTWLTDALERPCLDRRGSGKPVSRGVVAGSERESPNQKVR